MVIKEIRVPPLDGAENVGVVEVYISVGDSIEIESPLISLESDKAVMDIPSPISGKVKEVKISEGDTVNTGDLIAMAEVDEAQASPEKSESAAEKKQSPVEKGEEVETKPGKSPEKEGKPSPGTAETVNLPVNAQAMGSPSHASPSVRGLARELGIDLSNVTGTGPKGRIRRDDVTDLVKSVMKGSTSATQGGASGLPPIPEEDYAAFGEVESIALSRIKKISGSRLHRNWLGVPHVTQFEDADITELESFRQSLNREGAKQGRTKLSPLIFILKAAIHTLREFPDFNSSLNSDGASITHKKYVNIGIAVDTEGGLVVPVIKNADTRGIRNLADELTDLSTRARAGTLKPDEMKGPTFTISSLGGIGGTYFTPIVNAPEVAILGISRSAMRPVWNGTEFTPRLILPFSVSYDHRVIDGAQGARFAAYFASIIGDIRRALL